MQKKHSLSLLLICISLLSACNQGMVVKTAVDVPKPLNSQYPLTAGVIYEKALREHIYKENSEDRENWTISTGASQVELFNTILPSLFQRVNTLNNIQETRNSTNDVVIIPKLLDIQFALPIETQTDVYEVWTKYDIHIQKPDGSVITILPLSGYGKNPESFFKQNEAGLTEAANQAFRDVGAKLIIQFQSNPDIKKWLAEKSISQ